jgi:hypothetical protein
MTLLSPEQFQEFENKFTSYAQENPDQAFKTLKEIFNSHRHGTLEEHLVPLSDSIVTAYKEQSDKQPPSINNPLYDVYYWQYANCFRFSDRANQAVAGMKPFMLATIDNFLATGIEDNVFQASDMLHNIANWHRNVNHDKPDKDLTDKMGEVIEKFTDIGTPASYARAIKTVKNRYESYANIEASSAPTNITSEIGDTVQQMGHVLLAAIPEKKSSVKYPLSGEEIELNLNWMAHRLPENDTTVDAIKTTIFDRLGITKSVPDAEPTQENTKAQEESNFAQQAAQQAELIKKFMQNYGGGSENITKPQLSPHI